MKAHKLIILLLLKAALVQGQSWANKYPTIDHSNQYPTKFGVQFTDPYTALENLNSDTTWAWVEAEDKLLDKYRRSVFTKYTICERLLASSHIDLYQKATPIKKGEIYFGIGHSADDMPVVYYKRELKDAFQQLCPTDIFQFNKSDKIFVRDIEVSHDYKYIALVISHSGSDWREVHIRDIEGKTFLPDKIEWMKFNYVIWDNNGFFYTRYDAPEEGKELTAPNKNQRLMYHRLGTATDNDKVILNSDEKKLEDLGIRSLEEDKIILLYYKRYEKNKKLSVVAWMDPTKPEMPPKEFIMVPDDGTEQFMVFGKLGNRFLVRSTYKSPNGKILAYEPNQVNAGATIIEQFNQPLRSATKLKDRIFCTYYDMGKFLPVVFDTTGTLLKKIDIPDGFSVSGFNYTINDSVTLYTISSFTSFSRTVKFDFRNLKTVIYDGDIGTLFQDKYITKIINYKSKDSTLIPMYIVYDKNIKPDASTPALMYGYGGFGISTDPQYNPGFNLFLSMGGVLAVPLIRGGGELGEKWHKAAMGLNKQKSFEDFIAAAEYIIQNSYTSAEELAIEGGSNGGLLVAAAMVQRPDLFKVVVPSAPVLDLVNFNKYTSAAHVGLREYGDPDDSLEFQNLLRLSPLHNLDKDVNYPATLLIASLSDDRVVPSHSYRFLASLQNDTKGKTNPYLLYTEARQGHQSEGTHDDFQRMALIYTFIFDNLGVDVNKVR